MPPPPRGTYLQTLALKMAESWTYTQATSLKYAPRLKRAAEVLARMVPGATFAKAWRPKPTAAIYSKLYHHRGQVPNGWLTDAIQGRINCDSTDTVQQVADFFRGIMDAQAAAADAAERPTLSDEPSGDEIQAYDLEGLTDMDTGLPIDALVTHCQGNMTSEGTPASAPPHPLTLHAHKTQDPNSRGAGQVHSNCQMHVRLDLEAAIHFTRLRPSGGGGRRLQDHVCTMPRCVVEVPERA